VVVVNLDGGEMLDKCLDAIAKESPSELIVVDNGSQEPELSRLKARKDIRLLRLPENQGFAAPANWGVSQASRLNGSVPPSYVAVVNNDCTLEPGYLAACLAALEADSGLTAVQGVILEENADRVDGCGIGWNARAEATPLRRGEPPPARGFPAFPVPGVSATAAVYRRTAFLGAGGFEETFFAYYEDVDLSLRLLRTGARFACVPAARARHVGSATGKRSPVMRRRRLMENRLRTLRRNLAPEVCKDLMRITSLEGLGLKDAAHDLGWPRAIFTALAAWRGVKTHGPRDRQVLEANPALPKLPR
jgi:GT2 family glycosyltransferase